MKVTSLKKREPLNLKLVTKVLHPRCRFCEERFTCETIFDKDFHVTRECAYVQEYDRDSGGETLGDYIAKQKR